jgi:alpha-glucosidase
VAEIYRDGPQADWQTRPHDLVLEKRDVTAADTLELALASSGGAAVRFKRTR